MLPTNAAPAGVPVGVRRETEELLDMDATVSQVLQDGEHVWIVLEGLCHPYSAGSLLAPSSSFHSVICGVFHLCV